MFIEQTIRAHINWKLREAAFYLALLKQHSKTIFNAMRPLDFTWGNPEHQRLAQEFLFLFSGFLSAFRCVTFYMEKTCEKRSPPSTWYEDRKKKAVQEKSLLAAFCFLRDSDVHDRTLSTSPSVQHTINMAEQTTGSEFKLNGDDLRTIEKLRKRKWAVEVLTADSVVNVAEEVLSELRAVVTGGINEGLL
jgi:hypothetical protein